MGFAEDLFGKNPTEVEIQDIQKLIDRRIEEDRHLDYKAPDILKNPSKLSEWVSAFLNAEGGLIIIGVHEDQLKKEEKIYERIFPSRIEFVGSEYPKERVEQLIFSNIRSASKPAINIYPVRDSLDPSKAIYLVEIPQGDNPPYQAADHKYYRRLNVTKYPMEHYEIADFFGRRRKPSLSVSPVFTDVRMEDSIYRFTLRFHVVNNGHAVAKYAQFTASFRNLEIESISKGRVGRIDDIRRGVPSIQWNYGQLVLYPTGRSVRIADIVFKVKSNDELCSFTYDLVAEDVDLIEDRYLFGIDVLQEAKERIEQGQEAILIHK